MENYTIGIAGKIGAGKDLLGQLLMLAIAEKRYKTTYGIETLAQLYQICTDVRIRKFATALKQMVATLTGTSPHLMEDREFKKSVVPKLWWRTVKDAREWLIMKNFKHGSSNDTLANLTDSEIMVRAKAEGFIFERTYRDMLQEVGSLFRGYHEDAWANALGLSWIERDKARKWIVTDVRYPNEVRSLRAMGTCILIQLQRENPALAEHNAAHTSETALDKYDGFDNVIQNNGTVEDLYNHARAIVNQYNLE